MIIECSQQQMQDRLISAQFLNKIMEHNLQIPLSCHSQQQPTLPEWNEKDEVEFKYMDRYILKRKDQSKKIYCEDPFTSKQYANSLKNFANRILTAPELLFEIDLWSMINRQYKPALEGTHQSPKAQQESPTNEFGSHLQKKEKNKQQNSEQFQGKKPKPKSRIIKDQKQKQ